MLYKINRHVTSNSAAKNQFPQKDFALKGRDLPLTLKAAVPQIQDEKSKFNPLIRLKMNSLLSPSGCAKQQFISKIVLFGLWK